MTEKQLCLCGCGKVTPVSTRDYPQRGWVKGQHMLYYPHHSKNRWPVSDGTTKQCRKCLEVLAIESFSVNKKNRDGLQHVCKACSKERTYSYRETDGGRAVVVVINQRHRLKSFKISVEQYNKMLEEQDWVCAICKRPERNTFKGNPRQLAVDHCRDTGVIRGLLCTHCNQAIGKFDHDPALLQVAIEYLKKPGKPMVRPRSLL